MDKTIGFVTELSGPAQIRTQEGDFRGITIDDAVHEGDVFITGNGAEAVLALFSGKRLEVGENAELLLDEASHRAEPFADDQVLADVAALQQAILEGGDVSALEEPAAGETQRSASLHDASSYERTAAEGSVDTQGTPFATASTEITPEQGVAFVPETITATLSIGGDTVVREGDSAHYVISVDTAPTTPLTVEVTYSYLSAESGDVVTGATQVTIPVGATQVGLDVAAVDDAYLEGDEVYSVSISNPVGGGYDELLLGNSSVDTTILDGAAENDEGVAPVDTTTLTLAATESVAEGSQASLTYTATVDNAPVGDLVVTLANGEAITILDGHTSGSVTINAPSDDVYVDAGSIDNYIASTSGGGYENLVNANGAGNRVSTAVTDTIDPTTLTLDDVTVDEGTGTATIGAVLSNPTDVAFTVTLSNGATIDFGVGDTTGTSTGFSIQGDDPYWDGEDYVVSVSDAGSHNFESLDSSDTAKVTVEDTITPTTLTLDDVTVDEGTGTASINATLSNPTDLAFTVTLSNGATIDFGVGDTTGTSSGFSIQGDDPYWDGEDYVVSVSNQGAHNFESLDSSDTAKVTIEDTIDTTTVTLDATASVESGGQITYTASVNNAPDGSNLQLTLSNGEQITIVAGQTSGFVTVDAPPAPADDITVSISNASGGNYESLDTSDTAQTDILYPPVLSGDNQQIVYEAGLTEGTGIGDTTTEVSGLFSFSDADGDTLTLSVDGNSIGVLDAGDSSVLAVLNGDYGTLTVYKDGNWTYQLTVAADHDVVNDVPQASPSDAFTLQVSDGSLTSGEITLLIDITNDDLVVTETSSGFLANEGGQTLVGILDTLGADNNLYSGDLTANVTGWNGTDVTFAVALDGLGDPYTAGGLDLYYYVDPNDASVLIAYTDSDQNTTGVTAYDPLDTSQTKVFTLTVDPNSDSYSFVGYTDKLIDSLEGINLGTYQGGNTNYVALYETGTTYDLSGYTTQSDWQSDATVSANTVILLSALDSGSAVTVNWNNNSIGTANSFIEEDVSKGLDQSLIMEFTKDDVVGIEVGVDVTSGSYTWTAYALDGVTALASDTSSASSFEVSGYGAIGKIVIEGVDGGVDDKFAVDPDNTTIYRLENDTDVPLNFDVTLADDDGDTATTSIAINLEADGIVTGTTGADTILYDDSMTVIDGDAGYDSVIIKNGQALDFSNVDNIEQVDLSQGDHAITLSAQDVLDMTDADNTLVVVGGAGDQVILDGAATDWTQSSVDGFSVYVNGDAVVHVQDAIDVEYTV